jgi:hypothetical protein
MDAHVFAFAPSCEGEAPEHPFHAAYEKFLDITSRLGGEDFSELTHSEVENYVANDGRELLRLLLQDYLNNRGSGRVGETVRGADGVIRSQTRDGMKSSYQSGFGKVSVHRTGYGQRGVSSIFPLDAQLNLPAQAYSHPLQKRVARKAVKESFGGVCKEIEADTGVRIGKRQVEEIVYAGARDFEAFYAQQTPEAIRQQVQDKPIQVLTFDGKGVVMRTEALREATRKKAECQARKPPQGFCRQEKSNRKRRAMVVGLYHIERHRRSPEIVARQFAPLRLVPRQRQPVPKPVAKKLWASLEKPLPTMIEAGFEEALRRDPEQQAEWVALVDGDAAQIACIEKTAKRYGVTLVIILDIIHVLEYLWKAARALFDKEDTSGPLWVADKMSQLLGGQVATVVRSLRRGATVQGLSPKQREPIDECATYLSNHASYLNYPLYLAKGYPIATGVIEGACRHLVKDRMDLTGARWGLVGGEAVLKLRALYINGDFDAYWAFHEKQEYKRNHQSKFMEPSEVRSQLQLIAGGKRQGRPQMDLPTRMTG